MVPKQVWLISIDKQIVFLEHEYFCFVWVYRDGSLNYFDF